MAEAPQGFEGGNFGGIKKTLGFVADPLDIFGFRGRADDRAAQAAAQAQFEFAQGFRPNLSAASPADQQLLMQLMQQQAMRQQAQFTPEFFTPEQEAAAAAATRRQAGEITEAGRQRLNESTASRGLFRSGVAAGQEREFLGAQATSLQEALLQQQLQFQQARQLEAERAFGLNLQADNQRFSQLFEAGNAQRAGLSQQSDLFRALLGFSGQQAAAAGQASAARQQAQGQLIGQGLRAGAAIYTSGGSEGARAAANA